MITENYLATIAANVRRMRRARRWSQAKLGDEARLSRATVAQLEICRYESVTLDVLLPIAAALGTTVDALLSSDDVVVVDHKLSGTAA